MTELLLRLFVKNREDTENPEVRSSYGILASITGIIINLLLAALKFVVGKITGSIAIMADAVNNLSDAAGSVVTFVTVKLANKPVDPDHPFGHGRMEYLGSLAVGVLIIVMGFSLLKDGVGAILHPEAPSFSVTVIVLLVVSILAKLWLYLFYQKLGKTVKNGTLLAASKDSLGDVLSTSAVVLSVILNLIFGWSLDGFIGIAVSIIVLKAGIEVCKDTVDSLLGNKPDPEKMKQVKEIMLAKEGILGVHDLVIHDYGPGRCFASAHAEVDSSMNILIAHELIDDLEHEIMNQMNMPICIHMDPIVTSDSETLWLRGLYTDFLNQKKLSLHDFRVVPGERHTNIIFDVALPSGYANQKALHNELESFTKSLNEQYFLVIHFDVDFTAE